MPVLEIGLSTGNAGALAESVLDLQKRCGCRVEFLSARTEDSRAAVEFEDEEVARRCLAVALGQDSLENVRELADSVLLGPNTRALYDAARRRGIPVRRLDQGSLLQLGHGFHQRRLCGAFTDRTSSIGETIGWDKPLSKEILRAAGIPVPQGRRVADADDAWKAAQEYGGIIVVKPESANHGRSVFIGLTGREEIAAAFQAASTEAENPAVLVERYIPGSEHRLLVLNGEVIAAARGDALYVTGDGTRTIQQLMDEVNQDPRRGEGSECPLSPVGPDQVTRAVLAHQGYDADSVPPAGTQVLIQRNGNMSTDVTGIVHPANRSLVALAANAIGLDIAGVDLVVEDISRPIREQHGAILEVNAMPGLMMHLRPGVGSPRPVDDMIIGALFRPGTDGRIPIIAVTTPDLARSIAGRLQASGLITGAACAEGTFVNGEQTQSGNCATSSASADLLTHPLLEVAVLETPDSAVVGEGLAFDRCGAIVGANPHRVLLESLAPGGIVTDSVDRAIDAVLR